LWYVPKEGVSVGDYALVVPLGFTEAVRYLARRSVAFAIQRHVQRSWCAQLGLCPLHEGIERPERFACNPACPEAPDDYSNALFLANSLLEKFEHGS
jgi:hypothetical protein